jgi:hypothetical protein
MRKMICPLAKAGNLTEECLANPAACLHTHPHNEMSGCKVGPDDVCPDCVPAKLTNEEKIKEREAELCNSK